MTRWGSGRHERMLSGAALAASAYQVSGSGAGHKGWQYGVPVVW